MTRRASVLRMFRAVCLVVLFSATLTGCHELYCSFIEGLTGEPIDCSHDAFPDLGDIELPPLPPPPSLPTTSSTSTTTTSPSTTTTLPSDTTTTSSTSTSTSTSTSSTSTSTPVTMPGELLNSNAVTETIRAARERAARR